MQGEESVETLKTVITILVLGLGYPIFILWLIGRHLHPKLSEEELKENARKFEQRLLNPNIELVESHFGKALPAAIVELYANRDEILRDNFVVLSSEEAGEELACFIGFYEPCDAGSVGLSRPGCEGYFSFADDGCGNQYMVIPGDEDSPVLFFDHEGGEITEVCKSISEFMAWPRRESGELTEEKLCAPGVCHW